MTVNEAQSQQGNDTQANSVNSIDNNVDDVTGLQKGSQTSENPTDTNDDKPVNDNNQNTDNPEDIVPESYDFQGVELPDGMELDQELTDEFSSIAKEIGLSQTKANKLLEFSPKISAKIQEKFESAIKEAQDNQIKAYKTMLNIDPEIGGANLKQSLLDANAAYDAFMSDEAAKLLADIGLNNHPAIVKVFMNIGKQLKSDTIRGGSQGIRERTASDWYPEMKKK